MPVAILHIGKRLGRCRIRLLPRIVCSVLGIRWLRCFIGILSLLRRLFERLASCKLDGHAMGLRQVDKTRDNTLANGPLQCLPFG